MKHEKDITNILQEIIHFGYSPKIDSLDEIGEGFKHLARYSWLNCQAPRYWFGIAEGLTDTDLEALIKALAVMEKHFRWSGGSVSAVIWTYRAYQRTGQQNSDILANWLLYHTRNQYVPFGTDNGGARSLDEFKKFKNDWEERKRQRHIEILQEHESAIKRKELRRKQGLEREQQRQASKAARMEIMYWFNNLTQIEQLKVIARDEEHPVDYFPPECANTDDSILRLMNPEDRTSLINRLIDRRKGPWHKICKYLIELS